MGLLGGGGAHFGTVALFWSFILRTGSPPRRLPAPSDGPDPFRLVSVIAVVSCGRRAKPWDRSSSCTVSAAAAWVCGTAFAFPCVPACSAD